MNKKQKALWLVIGIITGVAIMLGILHARGYSFGGHIPRGQKNSSATSIHALYPGNPEDDRIVIGAAHNIFVGKVIAQSGNKETEIGPRTQFTVEVISNIKGELQGTVVVDQLGGYKDGQLVVVENLNPEAYLLRPGGTYLLATRYNNNEDWYTLIAHDNARKILSTNARSSTEALAALAAADSKVRGWQELYPEEILDKADVANSNARNAFSSLSPEEKAVAVERARAAQE